MWRLRTGAEEVGGAMCSEEEAEAGAASTGCLHLYAHLPTCPRSTGPRCQTVIGDSTLLCNRTLEAPWRSLLLMMPDKSMSTV